MSLFVCLWISEPKQSDFQKVICHVESETLWMKCWVTLVFIIVFTSWLTFPLAFNVWKLLIHWVVNSSKYWYTYKIKIMFGVTSNLIHKSLLKRETSSSSDGWYTCENSDFHLKTSILSLAINAICFPFSASSLCSCLRKCLSKYPHLNGLVYLTI